MTAIGIHLPQLAQATPAAFAEAVECAVKAERLGLDSVSANDHVVYHSPWLDGPALLAAAAVRTTTIGLATTVLLPAVRGAAASAQALDAIDGLSGGRLVAGVGVGSHAADHEAGGVPFAERGAALDAAIGELRARRPGRALWIGSWGGTAGLRRVARQGDGWVASAYGPGAFARDWGRLRALLEAEGRDPEAFPNLVATLFIYVGDRRAAQRIAAERLAPALGKRPDELVPRCALGSPEECAERLRALADEGAQRIHLWPAADALAQLDAIAEGVRPLLYADARRAPSTSASSLP